MPSTGHEARESGMNCALAFSPRICRRIMPTCYGENRLPMRHFPFAATDDDLCRGQSYDQVFGFP